MFRSKLIGATIAILISSWCAAADEDHVPPAAKAAIQRPPYGTPISLADAEIIAAKAESEARRAGWRVAIAIVEPSGALVLFKKMDDTQYASISMAMRKAKAAAIYRRPTSEFSANLAKGQTNVLAYDDVSASEGGEMILKDGHLIGAIGVSGATPSTTDDVIAKIAAAVAK